MLLHQNQSAIATRLARRRIWTTGYSGDGFTTVTTAKPLVFWRKASPDWALFKLLPKAAAFDCYRQESFAGILHPFGSESSRHYLASVPQAFLPALAA